MKKYFSDERRNKTAILLAAMSPDMVEDIIDLVNHQGRALLSTLADEDGPPKPLAIFSREFMTDGDFPEVFVGMMSVMLADLRTLKSDQDFYEEVLKKAFALPSEIAGPMAKQIETYDILGGSDAAKENRGWWSMISQQIQEGIRKTVNFFGAPFGWENDQTQSYDIDFLYELKSLGKAVLEMQARARLMKGQATIAANMGIFRASDGSSPSGDIYGDVYGDPVEKAELALSDALKPLMGGILPLSLLGGFAKLFQKGKQASESKVNGMLTSGGKSMAKGYEGSVSDPAMAKAIDNYMSGSDSNVAHIDGGNISRQTVKKALELIHAARETGQTGDVYGDVASKYGEEVADAWKLGNIPGAFGQLVEIAGDVLPTTGDRELDVAIAGDVLNDINDEYGDVDSGVGPEIGGLFRKIRINKAIRKGRRRARRAMKRSAKQARKDAELNKLNQAQAFADSQYQSMEPDLEQPPMNAYQDQPMVGPEVNPFYSDSSEYPDDAYNTDLLLQ